MFSGISLGLIPECPFRTIMIVVRCICSRSASQHRMLVRLVKLYAVPCGMVYNLYGNRSTNGKGSYRTGLGLTLSQTVTDRDRVTVTVTVNIESG